MRCRSQGFTGGGEEPGTNIELLLLSLLLAMLLLLLMPSLLLSLGLPSGAWDIFGGGIGWLRTAQPPEVKTGALCPA